MAFYVPHPCGPSMANIVIIALCEKIVCVCF
jgi:hypothetical protein